MALFSPQAPQAWRHGNIMQNTTGSLLSRIWPVGSVCCTGPTQNAGWGVPGTSGPLGERPAPCPHPGHLHLSSTHLPWLPLHQPLALSVSPRPPQLVKADCAHLPNSGWRGDSWPQSASCPAPTPRCWRSSGRGADRPLLSPLSGLSGIVSPTSTG